MEENFNGQTLKTNPDNAVETNEKETIIEKVNNEENTINQTTQNTDQNKPSKNIFKITGKIFLWLIVICCIIVLTRVFVFKKFDVFGYRFYLIMSGSMEPTISVNDGVITKDKKDLKEGDIIAFSEGNMTTVHRITKVYTQDGNKMYKTKGDNNNVSDNGLVNQSKVKGVVVCRIPKIGKAVLFLKKNIIILVFAIAILIIAILIRRLI